MQKVTIFALTIAAATADISEHRFVAPSGGYAPAGGNALGVASMNAATGDAISADVLGTTIIDFEDAVVAGDAIEVGTDGKAKKRTTGVTVARAVTDVAAGGKAEALLVSN